MRASSRARRASAARPANARWRGSARARSRRRRRACCSRRKWRAASSGISSARCAAAASTARARSCSALRASRCFRRSSSCASGRTSRKALGSSPFDGEGVATRDRELVQDGVLQGYVLGSYSARKLGLKTTGNAGGTHNLLVESKNGGMEIERAHARARHRVAGHRAHGAGRERRDRRLFARRVGLLGGERRAARIRCTRSPSPGNLKDMYRNIAAIGSDVDVRGGVRVGIDPDLRDDHRRRLGPAPSFCGSPQMIRR